MRLAIEPRVDMRDPIDSHRPYTMGAPRTDEHSWRPFAARAGEASGCSVRLQVPSGSLKHCRRRTPLCRCTAAGRDDQEEEPDAAQDKLDRSRRDISLAIICAGTGIVLAATNGDDGGPDGGPLSGSTLQRAVDAAVEATGGGTVRMEAEFADDGGKYSVEVRRDNGSHVEVKLDE